MKEEKNKWLGTWTDLLEDVKGNKKLFYTKVRRKRKNGWTVLEWEMKGGRKLIIK